ncbi:MAG: uracil-DNA glycosylase [Clostridiales bacterium]|nr:uracil-DNA glycosylase [Clostridiales bacterium]
MNSAWEGLKSDCTDCRRCSLGYVRKNVVIGRGNANAKMMIIGEGPGEQEDEQGLPFVGRAGQLLDLILKGMMFTAQDYYIANILKCRPPGNRVPSSEEVVACLGFLRVQVRLVKPRIIICLGATAAKYILNTNEGITKIRGSSHESKGFLIFPTFHPAALLRDESKKSVIWEDFKKIRQAFDKIS